MIVYEDEALERGFLDGELPVAVMLTAVLSSDGELSVTAMRCAEHIAQEYLDRFAEAPFSPEAVDFISARAEEFFGGYGYEYSRSAEDILAEFRPAELKPAPEIDETASLVVCDGGELEKYENLLDAELDGGLCAAVTVGGSVVCAAGINDYSESGECEVYVECAPEYRRRGYARAAVIALCRRLGAEGERVSYKTYVSNEASVRLARSCGFEESGRSMAVVGYLE